jgi:hypothetical protein
MTNIYSNIVTISESGTSGGGGLGLAINNYSVTYPCNVGTIVASGTVIYNNNPVPNVEVDVGFCSAFDFSKNQFTNYYTATTTESDGSFVVYIPTSTPPGGANCIVAMVQYNGLTAVAQNSVTIPNCGGGGGGSTYPACPEWYIENPDGTYMGIDMNSGTYSLSTSYTYLNNVQVYHQGSFYATAPLFKCSDGSWWVHFTPLNSVIVMYYHIIPGQCTP